MTTPTTSPARECRWWCKRLAPLAKYACLEEWCGRHQMALSGPTCLACPDYEPEPTP